MNSSETSNKIFRESMKKLHKRKKPFQDVCDDTGINWKDGDNRDTLIDKILEVDVAKEKLLNLNKQKEKTGSSYSRLFNRGDNKELADNLGKMFTKIHAESIKQGNKLEEFIIEFINNNTDKKVFKKSKEWYNKQKTLDDIIKNKEIINKCFIPKIFLDQANLTYGNKTGIEIDFLIIKPDKKIILVEIKAGKDFDTKKSKGEVDSIINIKTLFERNGMIVEKILFVSYEAKSVEDISIKTNLRGCSKMTFLQFLEEIFDNKTSLQGEEFIQSKFHEQANKHLLYIKHEMSRLLTNIQLNEEKT
tara:strand:+ start:578 stop:1489 length:912 start_codon:yes stop_codon:yes gene_type:complete